MFTINYIVAASLPPFRNVDVHFFSLSIDICSLPLVLNAILLVRKGSINEIKATEFKVVPTHFFFLEK